MQIGSRGEEEKTNHLYAQKCKSQMFIVKPLVVTWPKNSTKIRTQCMYIYIIIISHFMLLIREIVRSLTLFWASQPFDFWWYISSYLVGCFFYSSFFNFFFVYFIRFFLNSKWITIVIDKFIAQSILSTVIVDYKHLYVNWKPNNFF